MHFESPIGILERQCFAKTVEKLISYPINLIKQINTVRSLLLEMVKVCMNSGATLVCGNVGVEGSRARRAHTQRVLSACMGILAQTILEFQF